MQIRQLLHLAVSDFSACLVALPNDRRISGFGEPFSSERKRSVPAPGVSPNHPHAAFKQPECRFPAQAAAALEVIAAPVCLTGGSIEKHDIHGPNCMTDAIASRLLIKALQNLPRPAWNGNPISHPVQNTIP